MSCSCHPDPEPRSTGVSRRLVLAGGLAAGVAPFLPRVAGAQTPPATFETAGTPPTTGTTTTTTTAPPPPVSQDYGFLPPRPADEVHERPMMFPVLPDATLGKATWSDTYLAPRSGGRRHEGQDLMGKKMLKLLAVVSGTIVELRHQSSGNSLYLKGDDGWYYCYLHINNDDPGTDNGANQFKYAFAPGMKIGKRVLKGDHVAFLGDSGNAGDEFVTWRGKEADRPLPDLVADRKNRKCVDEADPGGVVSRPRTPEQPEEAGFCHTFDHKDSVCEQSG
mgnify:CR=1 FL=1